MRARSRPNIFAGAAFNDQLQVLKMKKIQPDRPTYSGYFDEASYSYICCRAYDMRISDGVNIYPPALWDCMVDENRLRMQVLSFLHHSGQQSRCFFSCFLQLMELLYDDRIARTSRHKKNQFGIGPSSEWDHVAPAAEDLQAFARHLSERLKRNRKYLFRPLLRMARHMQRTLVS